MFEVNCMKQQIIDLISTKPKHYTVLIKRNPELLKWVIDNSLITSDHFPEMVYSALHNETNVCKYGNIKHISRLSEGWVNCGSAAKCKCTNEDISINVAKTKAKYTEAETLAINKKREDTMVKIFGVPFNSHRLEVKERLSKSKLPIAIETILNNKSWMEQEYIVNQRSLSDIACSLNIYYSTVGLYCIKHGFEIRQRSNYSMQEVEISKFLTSIHIPHVVGDRSVLGNQEIDILIPEHKVGIELNGLYWHSYNPSCKHTPVIENRNRHLDKTSKSKAKGIDLVQITDYEWINKTDIVKSLIRNKLGLSEKVFARKLTIKSVPKSEEKSFLIANHMQGYVSSTLCIGLYDGDKLMMLMSFGPARFRKTKSTELLRLCTLAGHSVTGGAHKLFKHANIDTELVSYCDMSKFNGNLYKSLGFIQTDRSSPSYFWTDGTLVISRFKAQKAQLAKWLPTYNSSLSESENMFSAGYRRYWDCGQTTWVYNKVMT